MAEKEQEVQQKLILYQLLSQRLEQITEQVRIIEQRMLELETTRQALDGLKGLKEGSEVLVPLGSGCYTYGKTSDSKLLADLGAGVLVNKTPGEAKEIIEGKKLEIEKLSNDLQKEVNSIVARMNEIGPELQRFLQETGEDKEETPGAGAG